MRAHVLRDFLLGRTDASALALETSTAIERDEGQQTHYLEELDEPFEVTTAHLVALCDAVIAGDLPPEAIEAIGYALTESGNFTWNGTTEDGARITLTVTQWAAPESSYELTRDTVAKYRRRLVTGERAFPREDIAKGRATPRIDRVTASRRVVRADYEAPARSARQTPGAVAIDHGTVAIAGATGLIGRETIAALGREPGVRRIIALTRRELPAAVASLTATERLTERVVDFESLEELHPGVLGGAPTVACALGTTIRTAGTRERFYRVDHDYVVGLGRLAQGGGVRHFIVVSALGADPWSRIFYTRVKGEMERDLAAVGLPSLTILRPSLLLGDREEFRLAERIASFFAPIVPGRHRPVRAGDVARVIARLAVEGGSGGVRIIESDEIRRLAR